MERGSTLAGHGTSAGGSRLTKHKGLLKTLSLALYPAMKVTEPARVGTTARLRIKFYVTSFGQCYVRLQQH